MACAIKELPSEFGDMGKRDTFDTFSVLAVHRLWGQVPPGPEHSVLSPTRKRGHMSCKTKRSNRWPLGLVLLAIAFGTMARGAPQVPQATINLPQPVQMTAQEDHRRVMDLLGIRSIPPGPIRIDRSAYDESLANPYPKLPDPLILKDGRKVTNARMWKQRREEILVDFESQIYGRTPANTPKVTWEVTNTTTNATTVTKQLAGHVDNAAYPAIKVDIQASLTLPVDATKPVAVIVQFTGRGSSPSTDVAALASSLRARQGDLPRLSPELFATIRLPLGPITYSTLPWQQQVLARGWGYATINMDSVQADSGAGLSAGIIGLVNKGQPRKLEDWGVLSAWAWGASRFLDYLETDKGVNAKAVGLAGHVRLGSAALLTMALDERFAMGYISSSGVGGAKLSRRKYGETVDNAAAADEYHLFAGNFLKYAGHWDAMPVDSHELIALAAPRPILIGAGRDLNLEPLATYDAWADARGTFMAAEAAGPVYKLLGKNDMAATRLPPMETALVSGELAFRQHSGASTDVPNWPTFLTFAARYIKSNSDIVRPPPIARRTLTDATAGLTDITLIAKELGRLSPIAGRWIWSATVPGINGKPGRVTLKVKVSGSKGTGNLTEKNTRHDIYGQVTDISDGHVIDSTTVAFKRCEGTVNYFIYTRRYDEDGTAEYKSVFTFTKCERDHSGRLKPGQTVAEYTGKIRGNDLILTVKESTIH